MRQLELCPNIRFSNDRTNQSNAAHLSQYSFTYNSYDLSKPLNDVTVTPDEIIRHYRYDSSTMNHDVCLLYTSTAMTFDTDVTNICLPPPLTPTSAGNCSK